MKKDGEWLKQKLAQNGFDLQDLSKQSGISLERLEEIAASQSTDQEDWNVILSVLNDYPTLYAPSSDLIGEIQSRIEAAGEDDPCTVFYGVNQGDLLFVLCQFSDLSLHGANVSPQYLFSLKFQSEIRNSRFRIHLEAGFLFEQFSSITKKERYPLRHKGRSARSGEAF